MVDRSDSRQLVSEVADVIDAVAQYLVRRTDLR